MVKYLFTGRAFLLGVLKIFGLGQRERRKIATWIREKLTRFADKEFDECRDDGTSIIIKAKKIE
jgi:hypothetical protein